MDPSDLSPPAFSCIDSNCQSPTDIRNTLSMPVHVAHAANYFVLAHYYKSSILLNLHGKSLKQSGTYSSRSSFTLWMNLNVAKFLINYRWQWQDRRFTFTKELLDIEFCAHAGKQRILTLHSQCDDDDENDEISKPAVLNERTRACLFHLRKWPAIIYETDAK